ncbi:MAG TPA: peptidylprolyl isomerase [Burkholderiales bacterium]|nr:peptidylprolyl isomerase [Burkholderiales bacterium]
MKTSTLAAWLIGLAAASAHAQVAKVNGVVIPQQRMDYFMRSLAAQGRPDTPELRNAVKEELINRELMTQEAMRRGLDKNPDVAAQLELTKQDVLSRAYLQEIAKAAPVGDDAMKKEYERIKAQLGTREYKVRHILVEKEDEAKEIIALIKKGASFEKLAAERSKDTGSKGNGGDLDWGPAARYVKPFADALAKLKKGQMTEAPVHTQFGWHVIRLDDERALKIPSFEEVKPNLQQQMQRRAQEKAIADLRAKAKIE